MLVCSANSNLLRIAGRAHTGSPAALLAEGALRDRVRLTVGAQHSPRAGRGVLAPPESLGELQDTSPHFTSARLTWRSFHTDMRTWVRNESYDFGVCSDNLNIDRAEIC